LPLERKRAAELTADYEERGERVGFCGHGERSAAEQRSAGGLFEAGGFASAGNDGCLLAVRDRGLTRNGATVEARIKRSTMVQVKNA